MLVPSEPPMTTVTNFEFAEQVGIHYTMASRLRNGERRPGLATVINTWRAYTLTCEQVLGWLDAIENDYFVEKETGVPGATYSGRWLRDHIFEPKATPVSAAG